MSYKGKGFNKYKIGAFCQMFAEHPELPTTEICKRMGISRDRPHLWEIAGEIDKGFDAIGFTGNRDLRRNAKRETRRESQDKIDVAKALYRVFREEGLKKGDADQKTAKAVKVSQNTIYNWRKRFGWDEEETSD